MLKVESQLDVTTFGPKERPLIAKPVTWAKQSWEKAKKPKRSR
jgi:hypothetical protein